MSTPDILQLQGHILGGGLHIRELSSYLILSKEVIKHISQNVKLLLRHFLFYCVRVVMVCYIDLVAGMVGSACATWAGGH